MDYIINFLSLLIIWSIIYYYINNYKPSPQPETFTAGPGSTGTSGSCNFKPWGFTMDACVVRCQVSGKTLELEPEIGSGCTNSKCTDICSKCSDPSCKWLNPPKTLTQTETHNKMIALSGNKQVRIYFYHDFPTISKTKTPTPNDGFFVLQYYKSRFPHEGIYIAKIPVDTETQYYSYLIDTNIENDFEYTLSLYYSKTDTTTDRSDIGNVIVTPTLSSQILLK